MSKKNKKQLKKLLKEKKRAGEGMVTIEFMQDAVATLRELMISILEERRSLAEKNSVPGEADLVPPIVMAINPIGVVDVFTAEECKNAIDLEVLDETNAVMDAEVILRYNSDEVVTFGETEYLMGSAIVTEVDIDGNECSVDQRTIENVFDYIEANLTVIEVDGHSYPAFRLI
ncbi:hypothetical protein [Blautia sp.]|uniref:hypothetical protein n=1 Tax=Blautia sp. TaxID=1955243 RepID=UPI003AF0E727